MAMETNENVGVKQKVRKKKLRSKSDNSLLHFLRPKDPKITSDRLTITTGLFKNSFRSVAAVKASDKHLEENTKAILNEDLHMLLDLNDENRKHTQYLNDEDDKDVHVENKSIFRNIEQQYKQFMTNEQQNDQLLPNKNDLKCLINERFNSSLSSSLKPAWSNHFRNYLTNVQPFDYEQRFIQNTKHNYAVILQIDLFHQLNKLLQGIPVTSSRFRRKFIRHFNRIISVQNLDIMPIVCENEASTIIQNIENHYYKPINSIKDTNEMSPVVVVVGTKRNENQTPEKCESFPIESYRTPENKRYVYQEEEKSVSKYTAALYMVPPNYKSVLHGGNSPPVRPVVHEFQPESDEETSAHKRSKITTTTNRNDYNNNNSAGSQMARRNLRTKFEDVDGAGLDFFIRPKIKFTPNEFSLRRKYLPHTVTSDDLVEGVGQQQQSMEVEEQRIQMIPRMETPELKFRPLLRK